MADLRKRVAEYYDLNPQFPNDVAFYRTYADLTLASWNWDAGLEEYSFRLPTAASIFMVLKFPMLCWKSASTN